MRAPFRCVLRERKRALHAISARVSLPLSRAARNASNARIARDARWPYACRMATSNTAPGDARAFADELERYRIARGLTPAEMARAIGASTSQVSRWRRGHGIGMEHLQKVAVWMDRPLAELQVLAGYPAPLALMPRQPKDPRFEAVRAAWDRLDETRRQIIHDIALAGAALLQVLPKCKHPVACCRQAASRAGEFLGTSTPTMMGAGLDVPPPPGLLP